MFGPQDTAATVPPELIQALFCKLCQTRLNSPLQSTAHYAGKNHAKNARLYLANVKQQADAAGTQQKTAQMENKNLGENVNTGRSRPFTKNSIRILLLEEIFLNVYLLNKLTKMHITISRFKKRTFWKSQVMMCIVRPVMYPSIPMFMLSSTTKVVITNAALMVNLLCPKDFSIPRLKSGRDCEFTQVFVLE